MKMTLKEVGIIAEKTPGWTPTLVFPDGVVVASDIRFARINGKRDQSIVVFMFEWGGEIRKGRFDSDFSVEVK